MASAAESLTRGMVFLVATSVAALAFAACTDGGSGETDGGARRSQNVEVSTQGFAFAPTRLRLEAGTTVTWTNRDAIVHTVTSGIGQEQGVPGVSKDKPAKPSGLFASNLDGKGAKFSYKFDDPGAFEYFCSIHPGMTGVVVVR